MQNLTFITTLLLASYASAWITPQGTVRARNNISVMRSISPNQSMGGSLHGQDACYLPLDQLDQEYFSPRIIQIAGSYPGLTKEAFYAVNSEPPAEMGQWGYDFSDPDGPQMGTVAVRGCEVISTCEDPVVIICEHFSLGVPLPETLKDPVDLLAVVDRSKNRFGERKFLVLEMPGEGLVIRAFATKAELPESATILGQVVFVQIPWLPCMKKTKSGFMEEDELY
mmetsp:Transcript_23231/g.34585  ORF Transcript_23231/g.34585 Transcript_23231/m.34585 type:complete len:225 (+) Transcript_23231:106-780(+)